MSPEPRLEPQLAPLTQDDASALAALHVEALDELGQQPWPADAFADLLEMPTTIGLKIVMDGTLAAFILVQAVAGEAEILTLATAKAFRQQGMARGLLELARQHCRHRNCSALWLEVHSANVAAIKLYEKTGFVKKAIRSDYYRDIRTGRRKDAIIMQLSI